MDTGNACVADLLDTAHHEMDCAGEGAAGNPHNEFAEAMTKGSYIVDCILPEKNYSQIMWYFITRRGFVICHITGRRRKGKGLKIPCKSIYHYGSQRPGIYWRPDLYCCYNAVFSCH